MPKEQAERDLNRAGSSWAAGSASQALTLGTLSDSATLQVTEPGLRVNLIA